jgi:DNA-directed RNA polymerase specialized sigma24 family protein
MEMDKLTQEEFAKFLAVLDCDRNRAAEKYEVLRRKLVKLFERQQCIHTEELADETIDRLAKKLGSDEIRDVSLFAYGIARNICLEVRRKTHRFVSIHDYNREGLPSGDTDPEESIIAELGNARGLECLTKCLRSLPLDCHELIIQYYQGEKQARIRQRKDLASKLGISIEALRSEANGVRDKLRSCVNRCLSKRRQAAAARPDASRMAERGDSGGQ